ncbi:hypothetical protein BaRGS_00001949 [Batillaria attramentaria]|uniref:Uncharacterized protein n=1 Tax=Batillaria attramentaria TaxID=370345 RepID=A0ABD0M5R5_9CAEN
MGRTYVYSETMRLGKRSASHWGGFVSRYGQCGKNKLHKTRMLEGEGHFLANARAAKRNEGIAFRIARELLPVCFQTLKKKKKPKGQAHGREGQGAEQNRKNNWKK